MTYAEQSIAEFLGNVASKQVTPAGGSAAAVSGAIGASLCEMVCIHTVGGGNGGNTAEESRDFDGAQTLTVVRDELREQRRRLLALADADAEAVDALLSAIDAEPSSQRGTEATTEQKRAVGVPLAIAEASLAVLENAVVAVERGNPSAVADGVIGAYLSRAALQSALFIVRSNVAGLEDRDFAEEVTDRAAEIEVSAERTWERIPKATRDSRR